MISIIIPVYNGAEWLAEAIESCLNQDYQYLYEIIIIDDGSTDDSLSIAKSYLNHEKNNFKNRNFIKIISQINKGLATARNTGIMNAIGDYILFLDADDILLPNALAEINKAAQGKVDIIAPSFKEFGLGNREVILMENPTLEDFKTGNRLGYCAAIRRSALLEIGGYSPKMVWGAEDYHLWFNLLTRGYKLMTIPEVLWMYRVKKNSMWTETQKHRDEFMAQIKMDFPQVWIF